MDVSKQTYINHAVYETSMALNNTFYGIKT